MVLALYFNEGMDPRVTPLTEDFLAINPLYFKQTLENKFDPINLSKRCTDVSLTRLTNKSLNFTKGIEAKAGKDGVGQMKSKAWPIF